MRRRLVWISGAVGGLITIASLIALVLFMRSDSAVRPASTSYWEFWLPWLVVVGNIAYIAIWATLTTYSSEEQTLIRRVQFHPVLETRFVKAVDPIGEILDSATSIPDEYAELATGQPAPESSDIELRYLAVVLRNQGQGIVDTVAFEADIRVPQTSYTKSLQFRRQVQLAHTEQRTYVITPIWNLPRFEVSLKALQYTDVFGSYDNAAGHQKIAESRPFDIPENRKKLIFIDEFSDQPLGKGWVIDYWGRRQPSDLMYIEHTDPDRHVLVFRGNQDDWEQVQGTRDQQSGAYLDFGNLPHDTTFEITARVRSETGTTGRFRIWCHDIHWLVNNKDRQTTDRTPPSGNQFEAISMLYTTTNSGRLRIHLHYIPGDGSIEIDDVILRQLIQ